MKLLGLRICDHDSNFSYFDGEKVNYLKTERKYQVKHHSVMQHQENKKEGYDFYIMGKNH